MFKPLLFAAFAALISTSAISQSILETPSKTFVCETFFGTFLLNKHQITLNGRSGKTTPPRRGEMDNVLNRPHTSFYFATIDGKRVGASVSSNPVAPGSKSVDGWFFIGEDIFAGDCK